MSVTFPKIKGFLDSSFVDWPGKVAAVVFLPGCNFRCPYCHNHRLVTAPETLETISLDDVLARLEELRGWVDGVCITGGEPTLHAGLPDLVRAFRARGLGVKLDTNGSRPEVLAELLTGGLLDAAAVDVKAPLELLPYRRNAGPGGDPEAVRTTLALLATAGLPVEVRTTVHPALLSREEVLRAAADAGGALAPHGEPGAVRFTLQRGRVDETLDRGLAEKPPLAQDEFALWADAAVGAFHHARGAGRA